MRYYKLYDGSTPNLTEIRAAHPGVSIPAGADLAELGYEVLIIAPKPEANPGFKTVESAPMLVDGQWTITWVQQQLVATEIKADIVTATQARLDTFAQTRNYDSILSACTYANSSVPNFLAEGQYAVGARDATWSVLYGILAAVQSGVRPMPTGYAEIEPELPELAWPV